MTKGLHPLHGSPWRFTLMITQIRNWITNTSYRPNVETSVSQDTETKRIRLHYDSPVTYRSVTQSTKYCNVVSSFAMIHHLSQWLWCFIVMWANWRIPNYFPKVLNCKNLVSCFEASVSNGFVALAGLKEWKGENTSNPLASRGHHLDHLNVCGQVKILFWRCQLKTGR